MNTYEKIHQMIASCNFSEKDRLKLLEYFEKHPIKSEEIARKIIETFLFYHVTLKSNPEYYLKYKTNNFMLLEKEEDRMLLARFVTSLPTVKIDLSR